MTREDSREPLQVDEPSGEQLAQWLGALSSQTRLRILRFLERPHYLEEVASHVGLTRQAARKHLDQLVDIGLLERRNAIRPSGAVTEYVLLPEQLFRILDDFEGFCSVQREGTPELQLRTVAGVAPARPSATAATASLILMRGLGHGKRLELGADGREAWCLGRDDRCEFALNYDPYISGRHADIRYSDGHYVLHDLASTNGTRVNWETVPRGQKVILGHGDVIGIGRSTLLFWNRPG